MCKALSEMTLEELWTLFPITLSAHKSCWAVWYGEERAELLSLLGGVDLVIHHIGSTAIKTIWAKPVIDILVEIPQGIPMAVVKETLVHSGYICMSEDKDRISFNKGYTSKGFAERVFHIHLRRSGDHDELYFRDYMNDHPALAKEYEELKFSLWKQYEHDRDAYTAAKSGFIGQHTSAAKAEYGIRY